MPPLNGNLKIVISIIGLLGIGAGIVAGYTRLGAKTDANAEDVGKIEDEQFLQWIDIDANNDRGIRVEVQLTNIANDVSDILKKVEKLHQ